MSTTATSVTPGIASTALRLRRARGDPFSVGGRHTMVGSASGTSRSVVKSFAPVTAARASTRLVGVPTTAKSDAALSSTSTDRLPALPAALTASSP